MSGFDPGWLTLREPFDHAARDRAPAAVEGLARALGPGPLRLVDLGCGLGSNARYLGPRLGGRVAWSLVDHDPALLARAAASVGPGARAFTLDLRRDLEEALSPQADPPADAVVTSALLDLASAAWLEALADGLAARRLPLLAALTVDGRVSWSPGAPDDGAVEGWFRAHQETDRGFGPSPGWRAAAVTAGLMRARGYEVRCWRSDWIIPSTAREMLAAMVEGHAHAAAAASPEPARVAAWRARREADVAAGALSLVVGHQELLACPRQSAPS